MKYKKATTILTDCAMVLLATMAVAFNSLTTNCWVSYDDMTNIITYGGIFFVSFVGFVALGGVLLTKRASKKISVAVTVSTLCAYLVQMVLLVGFYLNNIQVWTSATLTIIYCLIVILSAGNGRAKWIVATACLLLCSLLSLTLGFAVELELINRRKNTPLNTFAEGEEMFPHAVEAEEFLIFDCGDLSRDNMMLLVSLQGCLAAHSSRQLLCFYTEDEAVNDADSLYIQNSKEPFNRKKEGTISLIETYYPSCKLSKADSFAEVLVFAKSHLAGYILYDPDNVESCSVALSLCNQFNAIMVTKNNEYVAQSMGLESLFDATHSTVAELLRSEYFQNLNKNIVVLSHAKSLGIDSIATYGITANAWIVPHPNTIKEYRKILSATNRNTVVFGSATNLEESCMVDTSAKFGDTFIYCNCCANLATLSGFDLNKAVKPEGKSDVKERSNAPRQIGSGEGKHSLCIMLSDGDNIRVSAEVNLYYYDSYRYYYPDSKFKNYYADDFMYSPHRTDDMTITYGLSGAMVEIAPIIFLQYCEDLHSNEDFVMQISSLGYTYPSKWKDSEAFAEVLARTNYLLGYTNSTVLEIMDDDAFLGISDFPCRFDSLKPYFDKYTALDNIDGCLFIDFMNLYAGYKGEICWSNGKPIVSAKYSIWGVDSLFLTEMNDYRNIASAINSASTDTTSEDSYTFVIVHCWTGLDGEGNMVHNGNCFDMLNEFISLLDDDVELLTATEFINRLSTNVAHN